MPVKTSSGHPPSVSFIVSERTSDRGFDRIFPRSDGIIQYAHFDSQPSSIFIYARARLKPDIDIGSNGVPSSLQPHIGTDFSSETNL